MKKWQEFLLWGICFAFVDTVFDFIKSLAENGILNTWTFAMVVLAMFIAGWIGVFFAIKPLKNKKAVKKNNLIIGYAYFVLIWSVYITFDLMKYSLENNMLNTWYFFGIGLVFMFVGWAGCRLDRVLFKPKNK